MKYIKENKNPVTHRFSVFHPGMFTIFLFNIDSDNGTSEKKKSNFKGFQLFNYE